MAERDEDMGLDALFRAARDDGPDMPQGLRARMLADADAVLGADTVVPFERPARTRNTGFRDTIGGWYGASGLVAACLVGVWIGFAPPSGMPDPVGLLVQSSVSEDLFLQDSLLDAVTEEG